MDDAILVGQLMGASPRDDAEERLARARLIMAAIRPLIDLPERHRGRRTMAEQIAKELGCSFQHVYRLVDKAREGGVMALARMGERRDRGQARTLISGQWLEWAQRVAEAWPQTDVAQLANRTRQLVRAAWVGGAPSALQCWLKATAAVARELIDAGCPSDLAVSLLSVRCPRRFVEAEGKHFRVAGRALRDGKGVYDHHITPVRRTAAGLRPGDLVCGDITPLDIPVLRDDGSVAYARLISWHDVATNWLWVDMVVLPKGQSIRRDDVAASFARMAEQAPFGMPRCLYLDNGSEYKWDEMLVACKHLADLTGQQFAADEAATAPAERRVVRSIPFHPRGKRIEGAFGRLSHWLAWWFGYVGGNRMTKKVATLGKGVQPSPEAEVRAWLARTLADYHVTPQPRAEHMGGMSPKDRLTWHMQAGWQPWRVDRLVLALAFADRHVRKVTRGAVSVDGVTYTADFLMHVDGRVTVAVPRILLGSPVRCVYVLDGVRVLGVAVEEQAYALLDTAGAKEAARRRRVFRMLTSERVAAAGGPLGEARLAGTRAELLGLEATLDAANAAAQQVTLSAEGQALVAGYLAAQERAIAEISRRREVALSAEKLTRWADEDEETKQARAMGL
ncbi:transposase family protein [Hydrogenophilus thermoluteolus]|nr:transposase family protein [Hydrogenophilus thermoluteolus]MBW7656232.1 transposase family protein [Hydrogenophilus thermoluteolus]